MLKVLNVELKYTALKQLLATALAISLGGLLLEYVPLGLTILWKVFQNPLCGIWHLCGGKYHASAAFIFYRL